MSPVGGYEAQREGREGLAWARRGAVVEKRSSVLRYEYVIVVHKNDTYPGAFFRMAKLHIPSYELRSYTLHLSLRRLLERTRDGVCFLSFYLFYSGVGICGEFKAKAKVYNTRRGMEIQS